MQSEYAGQTVTFAYESDAVAEDAQQNGELASGEYPSCNSGVRQLPGVSSKVSSTSRVPMSLSE